MKSLIKKLANTNIGIILRNSLNFKPIDLKLFEINSSTTISDAFLWRTDNGYKTKFKFNDILDLFFKIKDSRVEFHFYSKNNELLKIEKINKLNLSNELEINSKFMNNINDYGVFYIYHFTDDRSEFDSSNIIANRCYLGYSHNNNLYSFAHGNTLARFTSLNSTNKISTDIVKMSLFKNQIYTIQKFFEDFDKSEIFFTNPTSKVLRFSLEDKNYRLGPGNTLAIEPMKQIISIKSNCLFLRPTVFSYKNEFLDVHHS